MYEIVNIFVQFIHEFCEGANLKECSGRLFRFRLVLFRILCQCIFMLLQTHTLDSRNNELFYINLLVVYAKSIQSYRSRNIFRI